MRPYLPAVFRASLALFLLLSSAIVLYTTRQSVRSAGELADLALESTSLALSSSAQGVLAQGGSLDIKGIREIFSDRVVAYAALFSRRGETLFHTNPRLTGTRVPENELAAGWPEGRFLARRLVLGTGLPAYEFNRVLALPSGDSGLLTLVLHTTPVDRIVTAARRLWWTVGGVLALLWAAGLASERIFSRYFRLQRELERRQQLVLVGQMTAVLAHEIRNALGSIKGYAQWLDEKVPSPDPRKTALSVILQGVGRIESLVQDLLLFSREEVYRLERLDAGQFVRDTLASETASWAGRVSLDPQGPVPVVADAEKLRRALANGIRNAIQAMGEKGELAVSLRAEGKWVRIRVADSGPGIPEQEIPRLFTPFHTTRTDGTGLGLAYSRKVMEGMGGSIELRNRAGTGGAVLVLGIPRAGES